MLHYLVDVTHIKQNNGEESLKCTELLSQKEERLKNAYVEPAVTYEEEKRLKRNLPQEINLSEYIGMY